MPLRKLSRAPKPNLLVLQDELVKEWQNPRSGKTAEPVIFEADPGGDEPVVLYVVWSKWQGVAPVDRADVILDAYEAVRGKAAAMRVATAMGLTPEEAREHGLEDQDA